MDRQQRGLEHCSAFGLAAYSIPVDETQRTLAIPIEGSQRRSPVHVLAAG